MKQLVAAVSALLSLSTGLYGDVVFLRSGQTLTGDIVSAATESTTDVVRIRVADTSGTIFSTESVDPTNVVRIQRDTAEQIAIRRIESEYREISRYRLASVSYPVTYYDQVIPAFQRFVAVHPGSVQARAVSDSIQEWTDERNRVSGGEIKWNGNWYGGDMAAIAAVQSKTAHLVAQGDRLSAHERYDLAIAKFQEALSNKPLLAPTVDSIDQKVTDAIRKWKRAVESGSNTGVGIGDIDRNTQELKTQAERIRQSIADVQKRQQQISRAQPMDGTIWRDGHWHPGAPMRSPDGRPVSGTISHWFVDGTDLGSVLPATPGLGSLPSDLQRIEASMAQNEARKTRLLAESNSLQDQNQKLMALAGECSRMVSAARSAAIRETDLRAIVVAPQTGTAPAVAAAAPAPISHEVASVAAPTTIPAPREPPAPTVNGISWFRRYSFFILAAGAAGLVALRYLFR